VPASKAPSGGKQAVRTIIHLDMDCFFASVAALTDPSLEGLPLLVCHSNSAQGTGEVGPPIDPPFLSDVVDIQ
jgi:DNA repair protein REV1